MLGSVYSRGSYLHRDDKKAFSFFKKASDIQSSNLDNLNNTYSIVLAEYYYDGSGVEKDLEKTFDLYKKAIIAGASDTDGNQEEPLHLHPAYLNTLNQVAKYYQEGSVTTKDVEKAKKYREIKAIFEEQKKKSPPYPRHNNAQ